MTTPRKRLEDQVWPLIPKDYKLLKPNGTRHVMVLRKGVTTLVPILDLTTAEITAYLGGVATIRSKKK